MQLEFQNGELNPYINFLQNLELKAKASRGRTKLIRLLDAKVKEFNDDFQAIRNEFFQKDDNGKFIQDKDKNLIVKDGLTKDDAQKAADELSKEKAIVIIDEYLEQIQAMYDALNDYEQTFEGVDATLYDNLLDQLDTLMEGK